MIITIITAITLNMFIIIILSRKEVSNIIDTNRKSLNSIPR